MKDSMQKQQQGCNKQHKPQTWRGILEKNKMLPIMSDASYYVCCFLFLFLLFSSRVHRRHGSLTSTILLLLLPFLFASPTLKLCSGRSSSRRFGKLAFVVQQSLQQLLQRGKSVDGGERRHEEEGTVLNSRWLYCSCCRSESSWLMSLPGSKQWRW